MHYSNIEKGIFLSRPNRFLAHVAVGGKEVICHVKNTGRCKELLIPNCEVYVQHHDNPNRKTEYSLISVQKGNRLVNIDSQAPNAAVKEMCIRDRNYHVCSCCLFPQYRKSHWQVCGCIHWSARIYFMRF